MYLSPSNDFLYFSDSATLPDIVWKLDAGRLVYDFGQGNTEVYIDPSGGYTKVYSFGPSGIYDTVLDGCSIVGSGPFYLQCTGATALGYDSWATCSSDPNAGVQIELVNSNAIASNPCADDLAVLPGLEVRC